VIEVASNDGCLLDFFRSAGVPVLGVEPARNLANMAITRGIPTENVFLSYRSALNLRKKGYLADLVVANNVLAHVPYLNNFVQGLGLLLKPKGVLSIEVPQLECLVENDLFAKIYQEDVSYFLFFVVRNVLKKNGLTVFHVERIKTHGGSLRIFAGLPESWEIKINPSVEKLESEEKDAGYGRPETFKNFEKRILTIKWTLLDLLVKLKQRGKKIVGYGAPAKGNTLLNYCGIKGDILDYTVDLNPLKQGHFLPGSRIPIYSPEIIKQTKPDYILILPWNIKNEIIKQTIFVRTWGGKFIVPIPRIKIL
ncbi:MAG: class I SAM-dependent methyltransferase, partial [Candidatus Omnitrophica bacterium]|nr:class I SAM-dependent methyltransferase [Candidatus Omnitrophota bacterium]